MVTISNNMTILVTGGAGFIGSNFIRYMYHKYPRYRIVNFDALTYAGNPDNLRDIEAEEAARTINSGMPRYRFVKGDITEEQAVRNVITEEEPDVIINFAAESHVDRSFYGPAAFIHSNVVGANIVLELAREFNISFIQISTDEIYGDVLEGYSSEESPIRPSNPYAASKAAADLLVQSYIRSHKVPAIIIRGSNNFGPYQYPEKLIPLAITNIFEEKKVPIHGTGEHVRTWVHVLDFVEGVDLILHQGKVGEVYNIAGHELANIELLRTIADEIGVKHHEVFEHVSDRPGADFRYAPHAGKIERELGWKPKRHIKESIPELVAWYRENEAWWKKIKEKAVFRDHYEKQRKAKYY